MCAAELEKQAFPASSYGTGDARERALRLAIDTGIPPVWFQLSSRHARCARAGAIRGYTVEMNSDVIERIETKIAFLESANVDLSAVVYRQSQEIQALRARLDALAQRIEAAQTPDTVRTPEEERPPHY
jgi:SlyX protein